MSAMSRSSRPPNLTPSGSTRTSCENRRSRADHQLRRHPAAKTGADQCRILKAQLVREIEIEIGEIIDRAGAVDQRRAALTRMPRRDHPVFPGEEIEPWPLRRQTFAGMQEQ